MLSGFGANWPAPQPNRGRKRSGPAAFAMAKVERHGSGVWQVLNAARGKPE